MTYQWPLSKHKHNKGRAIKANKGPSPYCNSPLLMSRGGKGQLMECCSDIDCATLVLTDLGHSALL